MVKNVHFPRLKSLYLGSLSARSSGSLFGLVESTTISSESLVSISELKWDRLDGARPAERNGSD